MSRVFDYIVVGAGVDGLGIAKHLAESGHRTLLLEQFPWPHTRGSSTGESRIIRYAHNDAFYATLMPECFREWRKLERQYGSELLRTTGLLMAISGAEKGHIAPYVDCVKTSGADGRLLTAQELSDKFPQFSLPDDFVGIWDPQGGLLVANKCLLAQMHAFTVAGGVFHDRAPVVSIERLASGRVAVSTEHLGRRTVYESKGVAVAAGPWSKKFAAEQFKLHLPLEPSKTIITYWKETKPNTYSCATGCPVLLYDDYEQDKYFYLKPSYEFRGLAQFGLHRSEPADPDARDKVDLSHYVERCRQFCEERLPYADPAAPALIAPCMYMENKFDDHYIIDRVPNWPQVVLACGWSGTGFKVAPVVGRLVTELLTGQKPSYNIDKFRINRFPNSKI